MGEDVQICKYLYEREIELIRKACNIAIFQTDQLTEIEKEDLERVLECEFSK